MGRLLVTVGTDGVTDWVRTPDGQRFNLGPVSVLGFVAKLTSASAARRSLDTFLKSGEVMVPVDEDRMWAVLKPHRAIWSSSDGSFMPEDHRTTASSGRTATMTIDQDLAALETHIAALNEASSKKATNMAEGVEILVKLAGKIKSPNQSKNQTYYNLGEPKVETVKDAAEKKVPDQSKNDAYTNLGEPKVETVKEAGLTYETFKSNTDLAVNIVAKVEETATKIDALVKAGRKFNAAKAKLDLHEVSSKIAGITRDVDITLPWVRSDLEKLASRADYLHGLFANAKV
jgi:hypothetical protein